MSGWCEGVGWMQKVGGWEMMLQERGTRELISYYDFLDYWTEMRGPTRGGDGDVLEFKIFPVVLGSVTAVRWQ